MITTLGGITQDKSDCTPNPNTDACPSITSEMRKTRKDDLESEEFGLGQTSEPAKLMVSAHKRCNPAVPLPVRRGDTMEINCSHRTVQRSGELLPVQYSTTKVVRKIWELSLIHI